MIDRKIPSRLVSGTAAFAAVSLFAAPTSPMPPLAAAPELPGLGQVLASLLFVIGAILLTAWVMRRLMYARVGGRPGLEMLGATMVGPKQRVVVVAVDDVWLVLGIAPGGVSPLHLLAPPDETAEAAAAEPAPTEAPAGWLGWLRHVLNAPARLQAVCQGGAPRCRMTLTGSLMVGPRERIVSLDVATARLVLAVTQEEVKIVHVIDAGAENPGLPVAETPFAARFRALLAGEGPANGEGA
jgi:flagellar protein FliO/FliZ